MKTTRLTIEQFPYLLRQINNPPEYLDCAGNLPPNEDYRYLCVIGSRNYSKYGEEACRHLVSGLKGYPIAIVSGLAIGIDSIAHEAAIEAGLKTVCFPGSGLSRHVIYPRAHLRLAYKILESGGTLLSSFNYNQEGAPWTFPARNRLMAGSSHATLIIEGRQGSGTLLTAEYALQFNRDIFVVPGSIFSELSYGPHLLFKDGATPIFSSRSILAGLGFELPSEGSPRQTSLLELNLSEKELRIMKLLQYSPLYSSDIVEKTSMGATETNILLSELELKDLIVQSGNVYKLKLRQ